MKIHRFYLRDFSSQQRIELIKSPIFHQIKNVLRMKVGDNISFFANFKEAIYEINEIDNKKIVLIWKENVLNKIKTNIKITLFSALIKKDKMEWIVQKAVELGVSEIVPIISERSEKKSINLDRLNKISVEASEQCGRQDIIKINSPIKFIDAFKKIKGISFLGDGSGNNFLEILSSYKKNNIDKVNIFIGPEGGWSLNEVFLAKKNKVEIVRLNNYVLRSETAVVSFLSLISNI